MPKLASEQDQTVRETRIYTRLEETSEEQELNGERV
jgi:hypothetical protein